MYMYAIRGFVSNSNCCALFRYVCTQESCKVGMLYVIRAVDVDVQLGLLREWMELVIL